MQKACERHKATQASV